MKPTPLESFTFVATRRMLWLVLLCTAPVVIPYGASRLAPPRAHESAPAPAPVEVPPLGWTTDGARQVPPIWAMLGGALPKPGPNQKRAGECDAEAAQVEIEGGCWVETKTPPPCPRGKQWEHEGKCWLPVAHAKPVPQSGGSTPVNVAGEN